jgi:hypothetical protein
MKQKKVEIKEHCTPSQLLGTADVVDAQAVAKV